LCFLKYQNQMMKIEYENNNINFKRNRVKKAQCNNILEFVKLDVRNCIRFAEDKFLCIKPNLFLFHIYIYTSVICFVVSILMHF